MTETTSQSTVTANNESVHSQVLKYLGGIKVPSDRGKLEIDWTQGALSLVGGAYQEPVNFSPGECLVADEKFGLEIQHKDGMYGHKNGYAGLAYASALANQSDAYNNMQAVVAPNLTPPVKTMIITKVKTHKMYRVLQMWGAAQSGMARAVTDAWAHGWFPKEAAKNHVLVGAIFIHPAAGLKIEKGQPPAVLLEEEMKNSMHALETLVYLSTLGLLSDCLTGGLTPEEIVERTATTFHPFRGY